MIAAEQKTNYFKQELSKLSAERQRNILGLRVEDWTMAELVETLNSAIESHTPITVWGIALSLFSQVRKFPEIINFTQQFDSVTADGASIPWFGRILSQNIREHIGISYLAEEMIALADRKGYKILIFGATHEINAEAGRRILDKYPSLKLCKGIDGYYNADSEAEIAQHIRDSKPDILLVGMSFPKKELFLLRWKEFIQVPVSIACGGYIDVLSGKTSLAPNIITKLSMSWLWRLMQEPKRLFLKNIVNVSLFLFYIFPITIIRRLITPDKQLHILHFFSNKNYNGK